MEERRSEIVYAKSPARACPLLGRTKLEKAAGSQATRSTHFCPQCGQFLPFFKGVLNSKIFEKGRCDMEEKPGISRKNTGVPDAEIGGFCHCSGKSEIFPLIGAEWKRENSGSSSRSSPHLREAVPKNKSCVDLRDKNFC